MKTILLLGLSLGLTLADPQPLKIPHPTLTCDPTVLDGSHVEGYTGCVRGQVCGEDYLCHFPEDSPATRPQSFQGRSLVDLVPRQTKYSTDGSCGPANGGTICNPAGGGVGGYPAGGCCSQYGYCGGTDAYCSPANGCLSGCTGSTTTSAPAAQSSTPTGTTPRSDGRCGKDFGGATCAAGGAYGGCCSQYGYCGSTDGHCLPANGCQNGCTGATPTSTQEPVISPTGGSTNDGGQTTDGTCGAANGHTTCGNWYLGGCCSMYGYCGNTTAHCGDGCQSGPCTNGPAAPGPSPAPANPKPGQLSLISNTAGVPAMHAGLLQNGRVVFLDKVENYTQLKLPNGQYAYSAEYDPATNNVVPLSYKTNAFCSGGSFLPDGRFISVGGNAPLSFIDPTVGDGFKAVRYLSRTASGSQNGQNWNEPGNQLNTARWYASVCSLPDGTQFVASGSLNGLDPTVKSNNNPTYEILSKTGITQGNSISMDILVKNQPYYMYPFIHVLPTGDLFVFVSKSSQIFNVAGNKIVKQLPDLAGDYRTYPNTGGSVLLPLSSSNNYDPEVIICGGGAYQDITSPTDASCGRIHPLAANPQWEMDSMPQGRTMVEGTIMADGTLMWVNGGNQGAQGFGLARAFTGTALFYDPNKALGQRWSTGATSQIARLYHSVALMLLDGSLMIAGSNPVEQPVLKPVPNKTPSEDFVTEFRVGRYAPSYLDDLSKRPTNVAFNTGSWNVASTYTVKFNAPAGNQAVKILMYHGGFITHSVHMNHRAVWLDNSGFKAGATSQTVTFQTPPNHNIVPPMPYVIYVLVDGVPAIGQFISLA